MRLLTPYWPARRATTNDIFDEMEKIFGGFDKTLASPENERFTPAFEVTETEEHYLMAVDLPGVKKEQIKIETEENILGISGERNRRDGVTQTFTRRFSLPNTVD
ncbi:MAG: Hsp20/alpha crystallin family protein [Bdellovibrio sp.]